MDIDDWLYQAMEIADKICLGTSTPREHLTLRDLLKLCDQRYEYYRKMGSNS